MPGIGSVRGDVNAILNGLMRDGLITSFETNFDNPLSTPFGLHVRVAADQLGTDRDTKFEERRRELQGRIMRQLEPLAPGVIVSVRGTPGTAQSEPVSPPADGSITGEQCRAARGQLGWSVEKHASRAGVGLGVIGAFERGESVPRPETLKAIVGALKAAGVEFTDNGVTIRNANE